jgi:Flp pilus assembly protein TadD
MAFDYRTALITTASALIEAGNGGEALFQLRRLAANYPHWAEAHRRLGELLLSGGLLVEARRAYETALALEPGHAQATLRLAQCLFRSGQTDKAGYLVDQVLGKESDNGEGLLLLGQTRIARGDAHGSLPCFQKAAVLMPDNAQARWELGRAFYLAGQAGAAEATLLRSTEMAPTWAAIPCLLAVLYWRQGKIDEAFQYIRKALTLDAGDPEVVTDYALIQSEAAGPEAAVDLLEQHLALYDNPPVRSALEAIRQKAQSSSIPFTPAVRRRSEPRLAVFVGNWPRSRHAKIAYGLRSAGWQTVLLCQDTFGSDMTPYFDEIKYYKDEWQALALAATYSPRVFHAFSIWSDKTSVAMVKHKPGKVVYDYYDIVEGIQTAEHEVPAQRYCIENADGLCCRDLRPRWVSRASGYQLPAHRILFPDYCWDRPDDHGAIEPEPESDGLHVVSCGSFAIEKLGQADGGFLAIAERLAEQEIHFHIYPTPLQSLVGDLQFEDIFSDYIALSRRTPFFHFHRPLPERDLMRELPRYHLGVAVSHALIYGEPLKRYAPEQLRCCVSARIFDYLDAGLPILMNKALSFQFFLMSRHGVGIDATADLLAHAAERLKPFVSPEFKAKARQARSAYGVRRQIGRLIKLYEAL